MIEEPYLELFAQSLRQATERHTGRLLDAALSELGWLDALAADAEIVIATLFPLLGAANSASTALEDVMVTRLDPSSEPTRMVLPALGEWQPPAVRQEASLRIRGLLMGPVDVDSDVLVVSIDAADGGFGSALIPAAALDLRDVSGIDPTSSLVEVTSEAAPCAGLRPLARDDWAGTVALGQLAVGHQIVGSARAMLGLACDHALDRVQFGQPIARFQALRHKLAETLVAIEGAEAVLLAAAENHSPFLAANAKAIAGRAARTASRHCQQVMAGIGYTSEHPFHRYMRRTLVLDGILGSTSRLTRDVGTQLLRGGHMPQLLPL